MSPSPHARSVARFPAAFVAVAALPCLGALAQAPLFENVTTGAGLSDYIALTGDGHGPAGVFADLTNDGYADLYLMSMANEHGLDPANHLFVNVPGPDGTRVFQRAANDAGAGDTGPATGAIAGDYDNDGDLDLYVLNFDAPNVLFQNQLVESGALSFIDVTADTDPTPDVADDQHGVGEAFFEGVPLDNGLTAAWADPDRDGDLDLYVGNHNGWFANPIEGPFDIPGRRDVFYINNGDGTFTDATQTYGVEGYETATGAHETSNQRFSSTNAVQFADFNNDRWPDLLVTNKIGGPDDRDMLYINQGADADGVWLGFQLITYDLAPTFGDLTGAAMGVDVADPDNDGDLDIYITDWSPPDDPDAPGTNDTWVNQLSQTGDLTFIPFAGLPAKFSWGAQWQDFDNNGFLDLHVATAMGQAAFADFLYMSLPGGLTDFATELGVAQQRNSRGDMTADYDRDGWVDLFVVNLDGGPSTLFRNNIASFAPEARFLNVLLKGDPNAPGRLKSARDAIGARVRIRADLNGDGQFSTGETLMREVVSGSSNAASTSSLALEFGLGGATSAELEVLWPSGLSAAFIVQADQFLVIEEAAHLPGDLNADGVVDGADLGLLLQAWDAAGPTDTPADFNGDGKVDGADLGVMLQGWSP